MVPAGWPPAGGPDHLYEAPRKLATALLPPSSSHQMRSRASSNRNADVANPQQSCLVIWLHWDPVPWWNRAGAAVVIPQLWTHLLASPSTLWHHPGVTSFPCSGQAMGWMFYNVLFLAPHDLHSTRTESFLPGLEDLEWAGLGRLLGPPRSTWMTRGPHICCCPRHQDFFGMLPWQVCCVYCLAMCCWHDNNDNR